MAKPWVPCIWELLNHRVTCEQPSTYLTVDTVDSRTGLRYRGGAGLIPVRFTIDRYKNLMAVSINRGFFERGLGRLYRRWELI